jgi:hypothetical protein
MMFPKGIWKLDWSKICPLNEKDLLYLLSNDVAFGLINLMDEKNYSFKLKSIIDEPKNKEVFGPTGFDERSKEFAELMDAKIERFFETNKTSYIFFDAEEQKFLKEVFESYTLTCQIKIYIKKNGNFEVIDLDNINSSDYRKIRKFFKLTNVIYVIRPERYVYLNNIRKNKAEKNQDRIKQTRKAKEEADMNAARKILLKYPGLNDIKNEEEFKSFYRALAKQYHPDKNQGDSSRFVEINKDFEDLTKSIWYKKLLDPQRNAKPKTEYKSLSKKKRKRTFIEKMFGA